MHLTTARCSVNTVHGEQYRSVCDAHLRRQSHQFRSPGSPVLSGLNFETVLWHLNPEDPLTLNSISASTSFTNFQISRLKCVLCLVCLAIQDPMQDPNGDKSICNGNSGFSAIYPPPQPFLRFSATACNVISETVSTGNVLVSCDSAVCSTH